MFRLAVLLFVVGCSLADELNIKNQWGSFKSTFKKEFKSKHQENLKQAHWENKVKNILKHNMEADMGLHSYKKAINEFSDYTQEDIDEKLTGLIVPKNLMLDSEPVQDDLLPAPDNFDWRDRGVVTAAKSQGSCGSCWAFSVAATIESALAIKTGKTPVDLSPQHLVDCAGTYGARGCGGGWPGFGFRYVTDNGISSLKCYPYEKVQKTCRYDVSCNQTKISRFSTTPHNEAGVKEYLYNKGPLLVLIVANDNLTDYDSGIYTDDHCKGDTNHAVVLVGYGTEDGKDYWTVKNSWGSYWGEKGFFRMARNYKNMCKVATMASYPII